MADQSPAVNPSGTGSDCAEGPSMRAAAVSLSGMGSDCAEGPSTRAATAASDAATTNERHQEDEGRPALARPTKTRPRSNPRLTEQRLPNLPSRRETSKSSTQVRGDATLF